MFVLSIKGQPCTWFRAALERGDLPGVRSAAAELPDALAIVLLMADHGDAAYERAATRWVARLASERPSIGLQDLAATIGSLQALAGARPARAALAELCARYQVGAVVREDPPRPPGLALIEFTRDRERRNARGLPGARRRAAGVRRSAERPWENQRQPHRRRRRQWRSVRHAAA